MSKSRIPIPPQVIQWAAEGLGARAIARQMVEGEPGHQTPVVSVSTVSRWLRGLKPSPGLLPPDPRQESGQARGYQGDQKANNS